MDYFSEIKNEINLGTDFSEKVQSFDYRVMKWCIQKDLNMLTLQSN